MAVFTRNIIGIVLLLSISFTVGCSTMQSGGGQKTTMPSLFPWSKPKEPERITKVEDFIARPRPNHLTLR